MLVSRIWLTDFRNYTFAETALAPGLTVVVGGNGEGKTSLLEAVGYLATLSSFRGAPTDALVRHGRRPYRHFRTDEPGAVGSTTAPARP